ncbi:hypothetical protein AAC387_Pa11g0615 [Persea americana]
MDMLMPASGYQGLDHPSVDLRQVGLGIFKGTERHQRLPILGKLYEEFMPIDSLLEEQSEEFRLLYFQLVAFYDFLKEKEGSKVRYSSWKNFSSLSPNFFNGEESSEGFTWEARAKTPSSKKISVM